MSKINLPKRPRSHVIGDNAFNELKNLLPEKWIVRPSYGDYGIDSEIEIVEEDRSVTGAILKCQIKGSERDISSISVRTSTIMYWLSIPVPVIIILICYPEKKGKWLYVRDYLLEKGSLEKIIKNKQETLSFSFKNANILPDSSAELYNLAIEHSCSVLDWLEDAENMIKGHYIGYHILIHVFDGDPDKWIKWLREKGSDEQMNDISFVLGLKSQLLEDPGLIDRISAMVNEDSSPGGYLHGLAKKKGIIKI